MLTGNRSCLMQTLEFLGTGQARSMEKSQDVGTGCVININILTIYIVQRWKFIYIRDIVLDVLAQSTTCGVSPTVGMVMKLDKRIRDYELFDMNSGPRADATQPAQAIVYQRNIMFCIKESTLAYLHRSVFVKPVILQTAQSW
jgi:hypothetical protein